MIDWKLERVYDLSLHCWVLCYYGQTITKSKPYVKSRLRIIGRVVGDVVELVGNARWLTGGTVTQIDFHLTDKHSSMRSSQHDLKLTLISMIRIVANKSVYHFIAWSKITKDVISKSIIHWKSFIMNCKIVVAFNKNVDVRICWAVCWV